MADNPSAKNQLKSYSDEGIFYLQILGNTQEGRKTVEPLANKPESPDALFANGGFTCTLYSFCNMKARRKGYATRKAMADQYGKIKEGRKMEGDGYWFVDSKAALDKIWDKVKAQKPGVISIYLLYA